MEPHVGSRILVVEDEFLIAAEIESLLKDQGYRVVGPVGTVREGLRLAEVEACDAAILDVRINGGDSMPIAAALAARGCPFVFASGYSQGDAQLWPGARLLRKPFDSQEILDVVSSMIRPAEDP